MGVNSTTVSSRYTFLLCLLSKLRTVVTIVANVNTLVFFCLLSTSMSSTKQSFSCPQGFSSYPANIHGTGSSSFRMLCIAAAAAFSAILLMLFCYHWWRKRAANSFESGPLNLQSRGLARETRGESWPSRRRLSAHRRTSTSKNSVNG
jgi:hypothetical protein